MYPELLIIPLMLILDQASKAWAAANLSGMPEGLPLIPGVLRAVYAENFGAAFSMLQNARPFFLVVTAVFLLVLTVAYFREGKRGKLFRLGVLFTFAGGAGNLIDRIRLGYVVDFIEPLFIRFAIFNVADICVTAGAVLFAVWLLFVEGWRGDRRARDSR